MQMFTLNADLNHLDFAPNGAWPTDQKIVLKALAFYEKEISKGMVLLEPGNLLYATFIKS